MTVQRCQLPHRSCASRRASVLLEILISIGLFVAAGMTIFGSVRQSLRSVEGAHDRAQAVDLATSAMAMLEAGLTTPTMLTGPALRTMEHIENATGAVGNDRAADAADLPADDSERTNDDALFVDVKNPLPTVEERLAKTLWELEVQAERSAFAGLFLVTVRATKRVSQSSDELTASYELTQLVRLAADAEDTPGDAGLNDLAGSVPSTSTSGEHSR